MKSGEMVGSVSVPPSLFVRRPGPSSVLSVRRSGPSSVLSVSVLSVRWSGSSSVLPVSVRGSGSSSVLLVSVLSVRSARSLSALLLLRTLHVFLLFLGCLLLFLLSLFLTRFTAIWIRGGGWRGICKFRKLVFLIYETICRWKGKNLEKFSHYN